MFELKIILGQEKQKIDVNQCLPYGQSNLQYSSIA